MRMRMHYSSNDSKHVQSTYSYVERLSNIPFFEAQFEFIPIRCAVHHQSSRR